MEGLEWNQEVKQEEETKSARGEIEENRDVNLMADLPPNIISSNLWVPKFQEHEIVGKC